MADPESSGDKPQQDVSVTTVLKRILSRLGVGNALAIVAITISAIALWIQFSDSMSSDADRTESQVAAEDAAKRNEAILKASRDIADSVKKADVPVLNETVNGDSRDLKILEFLDRHQEKVVRLQLTIPSDNYTPPESWDDLSAEEKKYIPKDAFEMEEVQLGCLTTTDECRAGAIVFFEDCPGMGQCIGWYSGFWKIDGYFTVIATQAQMGEMRFSLKPIAPEMVRLR